MKNNKGITLVALIVIIILLIIFSSIAIYTSVKSYEMIGLQKYKAQMQAIQNALDEFYEKYENFYERNKDTFRTYGGTETENMKLYLVYLMNNDDQTTLMEYLNSLGSDLTNFENGTSDIEDIVTITIKNAENHEISAISQWWNDLAPKYGISINEPSIKEQYYGIDIEQIEEILGVTNIDVSEYFVINFQKRYVFSVSSIDIITTENESKTIHCLYELNSEEKVIEFKAQNTSGSLDIDIIEKTLYYQIARVKLLGQESIIKQIYYIESETSIVTTGDQNIEIPTVHEKKEFFEEVTGLETNEVLIKIKADGTYSFVAEDVLGGIYQGSITIKLHEPPVLENNMIPFKVSNNLDAIICDVNDSQWYNYSSDLDTSQLAAVVLTNEKYNENIGKSIDGIFDSNGYANLYYKYNHETTLKPVDKTVGTNDGQTNTVPEEANDDGFVIKLWVPRSLKDKIVIGDNEFINKTGIWLDAEWNFEDKRWEIVEHDHNWGNVTCTEKGNVSSTCNRCGLTEYSVSKELGHDINEDDWTIITEATCTAQGEKELKCKRCNQTIKTGVIEPSGHNWKNLPDVPATCARAGRKEHKCDECGLVEKTQDIAKLAHEWGNESITVQPTCIEYGKARKECKNFEECKGFEERDIEPKGHKYVSYTEIEPSILGGRGYKNYECENNCGIPRKEWTNKNLVLNFNEGGIYKELLIKDEFEWSSLTRATYEAVTGDQQYWWRLRVKKAPEDATTKTGMVYFDINLEDVNSIEFSGWMYAQSLCTNNTYIGVSNSTNNTIGAFLEGEKYTDSLYGGLGLVTTYDTKEINCTIDTDDKYHGTYKFKMVVNPTIGGDGTHYVSTFLKQITIKYN